MINKNVSMWPVATFVLTVAAVMAAFGCAAHRDQAFQDSVRAYNKSLKWQEYTKAGVFVADSHKDRFREAAADFEKDKLKIVDYQIVDMKLEKKESSAKSTVELEYYWEREGKLLRTTRDENWVYENKQWKIVPSLEDFKH